MSFFGLTFMGYQDPFRDRKLELPKYEAPVGTPSPKLELFYPKLPPIGPNGYDGTVHRRSCRRYHEAIRHMKLTKWSSSTNVCSSTSDPNEEYRVPMTCGQDIGWWLPKNRSVRPEDAIPWMRVERHPQLRSPMTKFVDSMIASDRLFSMF